MKLILKFAFALPLLAAMPGDPIPTGPALDIRLVGNVVAAKVTATTPDFLGAVIIADSGQLTHYFVTLPPLLTDYMILGLGQAQNGVLPFTVPRAMPPVDLRVYAQAVVLEAGVFASSDVQMLVLPATP